MISNPFRTEVLLSYDELIRELVNRAVILETVYTSVETYKNKQALFDILRDIHQASLEMAIQAEVIKETYK